MVMENVQQFLVDVDPRRLIRCAASAGNPQTSIHFGLGPLADFFGAFAHRPTTTPQHPGNVTSRQGRRGFGGKRKGLPPEDDDVYGETYVEVFQSVTSPKVANNRCITESRRSSSMVTS